MRKVAAILTCLLAAGGSAPAMAQSPQCPARDADAAEAMVDTLKTWKDVDADYARYRACDDGSIAEGNAEAIAHILVNHWATLPDLARLAAHRPGLQAFVLDHINQTIDTAELNKIAGLSASSCPDGAETLCARLRQAANANAH